MSRGSMFAALLAAFFCVSACADDTAIEDQPDDKGVKRAAPSWQEPGATPPVPPVTQPVDAGHTQPDAAVPSDAGTPSDAGADAAAQS
ncbi:MAG: hypothetical protein QM778_10480 [Myxococcales bacterium]